MSPYGSRPDWEEDRPVWERTLLTCVAQPLIIPVLTAVGAATLVVWVVVWIHTKLVSLREARAQRREQAREAARVRANEAAERGKKIAQSLAEDEAACWSALREERIKTRIREVAEVCTLSTERMRDADWIDVDTGCVQSSALRASLRGGVAPKPPKVKELNPCEACGGSGAAFFVRAETGEWQFGHCSCTVISQERSRS